MKILSERKEILQDGREFTSCFYNHVHTFICEKNNHVYMLPGNAQTPSVWLDSVDPHQF